MNRKEFFKKLGLGALVIAVAPKVLAKKEEAMVYTEGIVPFIERTNKQWHESYKYNVERGEPEYYYFNEGVYDDYMKDMGFFLPDKL